MYDDFAEPTQIVVDAPTIIKPEPPDKKGAVSKKFFIWVTVAIACVTTSAWFAPGPQLEIANASQKPPLLISTPPYLPTEEEIARRVREEIRRQLPIELAKHQLPPAVKTEVPAEEKKPEVVQAAKVNPVPTPAPQPPVAKPKATPRRTSTRQTIQALTPQLREFYEKYPERKARARR